MGAGVRCPLCFNARQRLFFWEQFFMHGRVLGLVVLVGLMGCGSTEVVKLEADRYMVSEKNAKVGFVSAAEEKASVYR